MNDAEKAEEKINNEKNANIIDVEPPLKGICTNKNITSNIPMDSSKLKSF